MSHIDRSFERLVLANPNPTVEVDGKPSGEEMLALVEGVSESRRPVLPLDERRTWRSGVLVAAAAFVMVAVLVPALWILTRTSEEIPVVTDPRIIPSTVVETTEAPTITTSAAVIDGTTQANLDRFVEIYNAGDVGAFMGFLAPDFVREIRRDRDDTVQTLETVRLLYEIDAALNTELTLSCGLNFGSLQCETLKFNDLNRVLGNPPTAHWTSIFEFDDGLLVRWFENRLNVDTDYDAQIRPFMAWVRANHPEVGELSRFVAGDWVTREGIGAEIAGLVEEWAGSLGVTLDPAR